MQKGLIDDADCMMSASFVGECIIKNRHVIWTNIVIWRMYIHALRTVENIHAPYYEYGKKDQNRDESISSFQCGHLLIIRYTETQIIKISLVRKTGKKQQNTW